MQILPAGQAQQLRRTWALGMDCKRPYPSKAERLEQEKGAKGSSTSRPSAFVFLGKRSGSDGSAASSTFRAVSPWWPGILQIFTLKTHYESAELYLVQASWMSTSSPALRRRRFWTISTAWPSRNMPGRSSTSSRSGRHLMSFSHFLLGTQSLTQELDRISAGGRHLGTTSTAGG